MKLSSDSLVNPKRILIVSIAIATASYLPTIITSIVNYSIPLSILLCLLLYLKFVFNEFNTDNLFINFIQENSIFMIVPLFILFTGIVYNAINI